MDEVREDFAGDRALEAAHDLGLGLAFGGAAGDEVTERLGVSAKARSVLRRENVFYADDDPVEKGIQLPQYELASAASRTS